MDAVKFINEVNRMCKSYDDVCTGCPLMDSNCLVNDFDVEAEKVVPVVEKWSKEHPKKKTNGDMIKALLPKERKYTLPFKDIITINLDKDWWDAEAPEHDGCNNCKHNRKDAWEEPCKVCKQNYLDRWEADA